MANVLTFTPSNRVLVSIKPEPVQRQAWIKLCLFQNLRAAKDKKKGLRWYGVEMYGYVYTEPLQREGAKRFLACLGMIRYMEKVGG